MKYCCASCFVSEYIGQIINSSKEVGTCDFCDSQNVTLYEPKKLIFFFKSILDLFVVSNEGCSIDSQIVIHFPNKVFSNAIRYSNKAKELIEEIVEEDIDSYHQLFNNNVKLQLTTNKEVESLLSLWENFTQEIISKNRFHLINSPNNQNLVSLFKNYDRIIPKGTVFYRARISKDHQGYMPEFMGSPPGNLASSGRANPEGISYLYVADSIDTALHEVRANLLDYVSVGEFILKENLSVINLSNRTYDIFRLAESETLEKVLLHKEFIDTLEYQLAIPRRSSDSKLDYLPTQYISELIKSMGYDGIEYASSLSNMGVNLAVFHSEKLRCVSSTLLDITRIELKYKKV